MNLSLVGDPDEPYPQRKPRRRGDFDYLRDITDRQRRVVDALTEGNSVPEAARLTDTPRASIYLWLDTSVAFNTALNRRRQIEWDHNVDILRAADAVAGSRLLDLLEDASFDEVIAYLRLRGVGKIDTRPTGPTDVADAVEPVTEARYRSREREILDEAALARAAAYDGEIGPRREAVREFVEDEFRRSAQKAAHSFEPDDTGPDDFLDEV
ncbi:MAG: hypothetical protein U0Q22_19725 [Acidimicrobiales bacterium]